MKINKNKYSLKKAFSLIELSIVILIIGILVAGVTQSSRLVSRMRILSARSITQSAPVSSIKDLYSWHETVLESSFDEAEASDGTRITNWYDFNPQTSTDKILINQTDVNLKPLYSSGKINGLPAVYFDGSDRMSSMVMVPAITQGGSATVFTVFNSQEVSNQRYLVYQMHSNCANSIEIGETAGAFNAGNYGIHSGCGYATATTSSVLNINQNNIMSLVMSPTPLSNGSASNIKVYKNGISFQTYVNGGGYNTGLGGSYAKNNTYLNIGGRFYSGVVDDCRFIGNIGEIIIFSRALNDEERSAVEKYLGKKWGIAVQ